MKNAIIILFILIVFNLSYSAGHVKEIVIASPRNYIKQEQPRDWKKQHKIIKDNFERINRIKNWSKIDSKDIFQSTEGGCVDFYYEGKSLQKAIAYNLGESGRSITEYYFLNGKLSFVFERVYTYNRPIYWDENKRKEYDDVEIFDFEKSKINEVRSYFINETLIKQLHTETATNVSTDKELLDIGDCIKSKLTSLLKEKKD